jgi:hypothetical protein
MAACGFPSAKNGLSGSSASRCSGSGIRPQLSVYSSGREESSTARLEEHAVARVERLAMPDLDPNLLALMGVSSGTYLGLKISEKG